MKYLLVGVYAAFAYVCSLDLFWQADFLVTIFFTSTACILCAIIAMRINDIFAEFFVFLQACALILYSSMAISYAWFDMAHMKDLEIINKYLLITDIIALAGVMIGDRRLFNQFC